MQKEALDRNTKRMIYDDLLEQQEKKVKQRTTNLKVFDADNRRPPLPNTLVSKVDRIQKFINQIKQGTFDQTHDLLIEECQQLNFRHHIPEIAKAISVNKLGPSERQTLITITELMHQRYETYLDDVQQYKYFADELIPELEKQFYITPVLSQFNRKRNLLRMLTELYFNGIVVDYRKVFKCLNQLIKLNFDQKEESEEQFKHALMVINDYLKTYGEQIFQILPRDHRLDIQNDYEVCLKDQDRYEFLEASTRKKIYKYLCEDYYQQKCLALSNLKFKQLKEIQQQFWDNQKETQIDPQLQTCYVQKKEEFIKIHELIKDTANLLDLDVPEYVIEQAKVNQIAVTKKQDRESWEPFDDELTYTMYRVFPDLRRFVVSDQIQEIDWVQELNELSKKIHKSQSIQMIDQRAEQIVKLISRSSSAQAVIKSVTDLLFQSQRQIQLLPFYSRFAAVTSTYFPEIGRNLLQQLEDEFYQLYADAGNVDTRIKNIRYLCELTKFNFEPQKMLEIFNFLNCNWCVQNVEIICNLLEGCGQYMLKQKSEQTQQKFNKLLDNLKSIKEKENIVQLDTAFQMCRPQQQAQKHNELSVVQLYIQHLFLVRLPQADPHALPVPPEPGTPYTPSKDLNSVVDIIVKLPWRENQDFIFKQMTILISTTKFNDMDNIAIVLAALKPSNRNFVNSVIDHAFEQVIRGMEENDFKDSQRRLCLVKFIGCLYNYKVIHTDTLFNLLYKLINQDCYGNVDKRCQDLDQPSDCFRIRLVCTLLDSVHRGYFLKHKRRLLMDRFLIFFQRYIYSKTYILMDLEFMLLDTFESLRPKQAPKVNSLEEAQEACSRIIQAEIDQNYGESQGSVFAVIQYYCYKKNSQQEYKDYDEDYGQEEVELIEQVKPIDIIQIKKQQQTVVDELDQQEIFNFEQEFESMLTESTNQARKEAAGQSHLGGQQRKEIVIPVSALKRNMPEMGQNQGQNCPFALVTKSGKKTQVVRLNLPSESKIVIRTQERVRLEEIDRKSEMQRMKDLTQGMAEESESEQSDQ